MKSVSVLELYLNLCTVFVTGTAKSKTSLSSSPSLSCNLSPAKFGTNGPLTYSIVFALHSAKLNQPISVMLSANLFIVACSFSFCFSLWYVFHPWYNWNIWTVSYGFLIISLISFSLFRTSLLSFSNMEFALFFCTHQKHHEFFKSKTIFHTFTLSFFMKLHFYVFLFSNYYQEWSSFSLKSIWKKNFMEGLHIWNIFHINVSEGLQASIITLPTGQSVFLKRKNINFAFPCKKLEQSSFIASKRRFSNYELASVPKY